MTPDPIGHTVATSAADACVMGTHLLGHNVADLELHVRLE
jgi:hypothetical protein